LKTKAQRIHAWIILISLAIVWGTSFILIKKGLEVFSQYEVGALRISITFVFLLPLSFTRIKKLTRYDWKILTIVGLIGSGAPSFLFATAQTGIDSSLAGILNSITPLFTMLIGVGFFSLRLRWFNVLGVLIALLGAIGLISVSGGQSFEFNMRYAVFVIIATICYATNVNLVKYFLKSLDALTITVFSFFTIGFPTLIYLLIFTDFVPQLSNDPDAWEGLGYLTILAVLGTALALMFFNKLIKIASPVFAASVTYMIPVVAVIWGIFDGEIFNWNYLIWVFLILGGVFLVNQRNRK